MDDAIVIGFPAVVKAGFDGGRRMVEVEASFEGIDLDGDIMFQNALIESGPGFVAAGHLDLEHISELGFLWNIANPSAYIVGRPVEVRDLGGKRTGVVGEIRKAADGAHDPQKHRFDEFWDSLQSVPPVNWQASVFGYPKAGMTIDCRKDWCESGAPRFEIKGFDWRSLAFTRSPRNHLLKGYARVVSAELYAKASPFAVMPAERDADALVIDWKLCSGCQASSLEGYRQHFAKCRGYGTGEADIFAHAVMHKMLNDRLFGRISG